MNEKTESKSRHQPSTSVIPPEVEKPEARHKSLSMHDGVPVWYDCCSCEAEPYWQELADIEKGE